MFFSEDKSVKQLTEKMYKVPHSVQDTIPIHRISKSGIFELEGENKSYRQYDKMYLFEDINYRMQDEEEQEVSGSKFEQLLRSLNVSYKILVMNHYSDDNQLKESIFHPAVSDDLVPLAAEYHKILEERLEEGRRGLSQSKYFIISCRREDFASAKSFFNTIEFNIAQLFTRLGSAILPLNATQRLRALHSFYRMGQEEEFSFDWNNYLDLRRDWRDDIINTSIREQKDYLEFEGDSCACALFVRKYANGLSDNFLHEIVNLDFPLIYTMDVEPLDSSYAYQLIMKKYMSNERSINKEQEQKNKNGDFSTNISYERRKNQDDAERLLDRISSFDERLLYVSMIILIRAESKEELDNRKERIKIIGQTYNMDIVPYSYRQLDAMNTALPTGARFVNSMRSITSEELSVFIPFNVQEIQDNNGFCYGFNAVSKNLIVGNRKKLKNGNGMVFGVPGSGKSYNEKSEMGQVLCFTTDDIIVVDPMGEYHGIAEAWGGQYINLTQAEDNICFINPFHVPDNIQDRDKFVAEKAEFAYAICEQALKPTPITSKHIAVIDKAVRTMYSSYFKTIDDGRRKKKTNVSCPTIRIMRELIMSMEGDVAEELTEQLEVFSEGTLDIFSHEQSTSPQNRFTVYGFAELGKRMRAMAMLVMIESITATIKYNQNASIATWVYIDEMHELWGEEYSLHAVERMWREVRKRGGICTGISQNIIDAQRDRSTRTMVSNSEFTVLLDQGKMDKDAVEDIFDISEKQLEYVNGADKGTGLIRFGEKVLPFDNSMSKENPLYKLFNTDFHELQEVTKHGKQ